MASPADNPSADDDEEKTKALIGAPNLISRNLPLPPDLLRVVPLPFTTMPPTKRKKKTMVKEEKKTAKDEIKQCEAEGDLKQQQLHMPSSELGQGREHRSQSLIKQLLSELEDQAVSSRR